MKRSRKLSAALALMLTVAVVSPSVNSDVDAAKVPAPKLSKTKLTLTVGSSKTISVKNYSKKVTWKTSKASVAKIKASKKSCKITAKKAGKAKVTAIVKVGKKNKKLVCNVTVNPKNNKQNNNNVVTVTEAPVPTQAPAPTTAPTAEATLDPDATPSPTPTFDYSANPAEWKDGIPSIKDTFKDYFISGISTDKGGLRNGEKSFLVRHHFGSVTMGNENKMESTVSVDPTDEYPEGLSKANVDNYYKTKGEGRIILNYETLEEVLSYCKANNLKLRYHAFVWHAQVREYFFLQDYNWSDYELSDYEANGWPTENYHKLADKETMKKRLNDYISQVIEYIYSHGYGDVVYAYDVINEATNGQQSPVRYYVNENADSVDGILSTTNNSSISFKTNNGVRTGNGGTIVTSDSSVEDVEKMLSYEGRGTNQDNSYWYSTLGPDYLYLSFLYTHNAIKANFDKYKDQYGYTVDPSLIYNDYNGNVSDHVALAKYINRACNLTNGTDNEKYCDGIGLQSHNVSEGAQENQIKTVADAGFEVQITELDNNIDGDGLATRMKSLYKLYMKYSKNGDYGKAQGDNYIGVTSVTQWGICDGDGSWGSGNVKYIFTMDELPPEVQDEEGNWVKPETPIFRIHPKAALYAILQAAGVECGEREY